MRFNLKKEEIRFGLIGAGKMICDFIRMLDEHGFKKPFVVTFRKEIHQRDMMLLKDNENFENVFELCEKRNVPIIDVDSANDTSTIDALKHAGVNVVFSIKSRWILKNHFIQAFNGYVLNIHQGDLPLERGGTPASHRIMNNYLKAGVTIHKLTIGIDAGPILYKKVAVLDSPKPIQDDMNEINLKLSRELLSKLLDDIAVGREIIETPQDNNKSLYLPQLYTELNGAIDWSWTADQIERFVRAFGPPFPGAFTYYGDGKVSIIKADVEKTTMEYHPFYTGRIVSKLNNGCIKVVTAKDLLVVSQVHIKGKDYLPAEVLKVSRILHTPSGILEKAKTETVLSLNMKPPTHV